jgi:hypothetical protein
MLRLILNGESGAGLNWFSLMCLQNSSILTCLPRKGRLRHDVLILPSFLSIRFCSNVLVSRGLLNSGPHCFIYISIGMGSLSLCWFRLLDYFELG